MKTFFQQSLIYRRESSEKCRTPYPGTPFRYLAGSNNDSAACITNKIITIEPFPLRLLTGERLIGNNCRRLITGQCTIKFTGNQCSSLFIGVDTIRIVIRIWLQQCIKIHNGQMTFLRYTAYHRNNTVCNYAIVNTKIPFYGRNRQTKIYLRFGRQFLKNIQHFRQILLKIFSITPIPGFTVIRSQFNGNDIRLKCQKITKLLFVHIRMVSLIQQYTGTNSEIADIVPFTQKLGKQPRITVLKLIFNS